MTATVTPQDVERTNRKFQASQPIGPNDYCDRCRVARAVTRATVKGTALYLCGNHTRTHRAALEADPSIILYVEGIKT